MYSNSQIIFTARRSLVSGVLLDDEIIMDVIFSKFDRSKRYEKKSIQTLSGDRSSSLLYIEKTHKIEMVEFGTVTLPNLLSIDMTTEYVEMFFDSVANSEEFSITDLDNNDQEIVVQLLDSPSRSRRAISYVDRFIYSFGVNEVQV